MSLFLVQHGQAMGEDQDPDRPLTTGGTETVRRIAAWMGGAGIEVREIVHSGKTRAAQTAAILGEYLSPRDGMREVAGLKPKDDARRFMESPPVGLDDTLIVGHLPFLSRLTALLVAADPDLDLVAFRHGGIVCLQQVRGHWHVAWAVTPELVPEPG